MSDLRRRNFSSEFCATTLLGSDWTLVTAFQYLFKFYFCSRKRLRNRIVLVALLVFFYSPCHAYGSIVRNISPLGLAEDFSPPRPTEWLVPPPNSIAKFALVEGSPCATSNLPLGQLTPRTSRRLIWRKARNTCRSGGTWRAWPRQGRNATFRRPRWH